MKINQRGFSTTLIIVAVVTVIVAGGGYALIRQRQNPVATNDAVAQVADDTVPNGTPENAVNAVTEQVTTEIIAEDNAMKLEEDAVKLDDALVDNVGEVANESNL